MLIESVAVAGVGPFRERVAVGPLKPGLNILAQPNEWGKSTLLHAICHALFDRYTAGGEEIRQLRPTGTTLSPRVELCFAAEGDRFRLTKQFLDGRLSELCRWSGATWERTDEADKADQRVRTLLGAPALENRAAKVETWGLIRYLWCRQDEPAEWPCWEGDCGETTRRRLATVEIDPLLRQLGARLTELGDEHFTTRGSVKKGSALQRAEAEFAQATTELSALGARRAELEQLEADYTARQAELPRLAEALAARSAEAQALREQCGVLEQVKARVAQVAAEHDAAAAALEHLRRERETHTHNMAAAAQEEVAQASLREQSGALAQRLALLQAALEEAQAAALQRAAARQERQEKLARIRALLQLRQLAERVATLMVTQNHVGTRVAELEAVAAALAARPALAEPELQRARALERRLAEQRARLTASGLAVRLEPARAARASFAADGALLLTDVSLSAGQPATLPAARELRLELPGWGRIVIESGAHETAELQREIAEGDQQLSALLRGVGAASLAEAEAGSQERLAWQRKQEILRAELAALLTDWKTPLELGAAVDRSRADLEKARALLSVTAREEQHGEEWACEEQALVAAEAEERRTERAQEQALEVRRSDVNTARAQQARAAETLAGSQGRLKTLAEQSAALQARHPDGLEAAWARAQDQFTRSEARLATARRELPAEAERLVARLGETTRAAAALETTLRAAQREVDRLKTVLEERGGHALYARFSDAEERLENASALAARLRREGLGARLVSELIQRREAASIREVLSPLEDRLSETFATLTGVAGRRVWFDEHLAIAGVGARREELIPFASLSRGAREQLLLALRGAIALQVAATDGPQCLVLDDMLVHTDETRHENVLAFLESLASRVQVLLLTCHTERYRRTGHLVEVRSYADP